MRLARYILWRLLLLVPVILAVSILTFAAVRILPGDPVLALLPPTATEEDIANARRRFGIDKPIVEQYADYFRGALHADLGRSISDGRPVIEQIAQRLPATLELVIPAFVIALALSLAVGIASALRAGRLADQTARLTTLAANAMPEFWLGLVLILVFYAWLRVAPPPSGRIAPGFGIPAVTGLMTVDALLGGKPAAFLSALAQMVLPLVTLVIGITAVLLRSVRTAALEIIRSATFQCALAHGLRRRVLLRSYLLKGTAASITTFAALVFGHLLGGSILVETVFSWQGLGQWGMRALLARDYPAIQAFVLMVATGYVLVFLIADVVHAALDPRVRI
jgi:peptide/nickel transport system permease protein